MPVMYPLPEEDVELAISALRAEAHTQAGHSQAPDLIECEDLPEWELAERLQARIDRSRARRQA